MSPVNVDRTMPFKKLQARVGGLEGIGTVRQEAQGKPLTVHDHGVGKDRMGIVKTNGWGEWSDPSARLDMIISIFSILQHYDLIMDSPLPTLQGSIPPPPVLGSLTHCPHLSFTF